MSTELTTAEVAERLGAPERTIRQWCKDGLFGGARNVETPRGNYWTIPVSALKTFQRPPMGRPPKAKTGNASPTPSRPGVQTAEEALLESGAKPKRGRKAA